MRTAKALGLATALTTALTVAGAPVVAEAGGWHGGGWHHHHGHGGGFWTGVGVVGGLIGLGIVADALTRPDVVYVTPPPVYYPPPAYYPPPGYYYPPSGSSAPPPADDSSAWSDADDRERDAYFAGYAAGRDAADDDEPYYPGPRAVRTRAPRR
jgi:hypothetical protein